ncbi:MAG: large conductance mechanosensitive channel protein MscL, partial [Acidobacteria bacterium]
MIKEFREFAFKGNVMDLAVAVILAAAFGKVVNSLVEDVIMPPIGLLLGHVDFRELFLDLSRGGYPTLAAATAAGAPVIRYGVFLNTIITFVIVAFAVFLLVRQVNRWILKPGAGPKECAFCASMIPVKAKRCPHCTSQLA